MDSGSPCLEDAAKQRRDVLFQLWCDDLPAHMMCFCSGFACVFVFIVVLLKGAQRLADFQMACECALRIPGNLFETGASRPLGPYRV
jgi:hypothetical protein